MKNIHVEKKAIASSVLAALIEKQGRRESF